MNKALNILILSFLFLLSCDKIDKEKSVEKNANFDNEVLINLKTVTICDETKADAELPTFLFYIQIINKIKNPFVFFVKNYDNSSTKGGFFLFFENSEVEKVAELADFWSENPVILENEDTLKLMLTSVIEENTELIWDEEAKEEFLNTFKIVYHPNLNLIQQDTSLKIYKILPRYIVTKSEKTKIFD